MTAASEGVQCSQMYGSLADEIRDQQAFAGVKKRTTVCYKAETAHDRVMTG